jgi:hypothetical protein
MSEITAEQVRNWLDIDDSTEDYYELENELIDLPMQNEGYVIEVPGVNDYQITLKYKAVEREYDSYGGSTADGYVILDVTAIDGSTTSFKLPYAYSSYEGWNWDLSKLARAEQRQKVITTWEWENI